MGDAAQYVQYAKNLISHRTFSKDKGPSKPVSDSYWAPGLPAFIAINMIVGDRIGVDSYRLFMYAQILLGILTVMLTFVLGRMFLDPIWSLLASVLVGFSPHLISIGRCVLTETLFSFLLLAGIYSFSLGYIRRSRSAFCISGMVFGLTYLVNPVMFFTPILLTLTAYYLNKKNKNSQSIRFNLNMVFCLILFISIMSAWSFRNSINVPPDQPSSSDRLLTNLIIGSHSDFYEIWRADPIDPLNPATQDEQSIKGSYKKFAHTLSSRIVNNPGQYVKWYLVDKPILLWSWNIVTGQGDIYIYPVKSSLYHKSGIAKISYMAMKFSHYFLVGFGFFGIFFLLKNKGVANCIPAFLYITIIYISAVYIVTQAEPRYSIPLRPEIYLAATFFMSQLSQFRTSLPPLDKFLVH
ncbi:ArnT family glycosyltransferase [Thermodesulfobacteriota bacterium]